MWWSTRNHSNEKFSPNGPIGKLLQHRYWCPLTWCLFGIIWSPAWYFMNHQSHKDNYLYKRHRRRLGDGTRSGQFNSRACPSTRQTDLKGVGGQNITPGEYKTGGIVSGTIFVSWLSQSIIPSISPINRWTPRVVVVAYGDYVAAAAWQYKSLKIVSRAHLNFQSHFKQTYSPSSAWM